MSSRSLLRALSALALTLLLVALTSPTARAQASSGSDGGSDSTGRQLTDFTGALSVPGFDGSLGELVAAELTISSRYDGQVLNIVNQSGGTADFVVATSVRLCAHAMTASGSLSYGDCLASASSTTMNFDTGVVSESFEALPAGGVGLSAEPGQSTATETQVVTDPQALESFIDASSMTFGVATLAGFEAVGGGGNSTVQVETFADVSLSVIYRYINLDVVKMTNGVNEAVVMPGDPVEWTYDVTNQGNTELSNVEVVDDLEGDICVIATIAAGATERCSLTGVAGDAPYTNIAKATGTATINPAVSTWADAPSSYIQPEPTPTPEPAPIDPTPVPVVDPTPTPVRQLPGIENPPTGGSGPVIDIEVSTNNSDADSAPGVGLEVGQPITWRYVVTNTGDVDLYNLVITDDRVGGVCTAGELLVGQVMVCTREGVATVGQQVLVATVVGQSAAGETAADRDPTNYVAGVDAVPEDGPAESEDDADEVLGLVTTPTSFSDPDEVLALTGDDGNLPAAVAVVVAGAGLIALSASEALKRRHGDRS